MGRGSTKTKPITSGKKPKVYPLTDKQEMFVREYCVDLNAKDAAVRAGLTRGYGSKMMNDPNIVNAIRIQLGERAKNTEINAERVLCELAMVAFGDPADMFDENGNLLHIQDMPEGIRKCIASMDVVSKEGEEGEITTTAKIRFWNKLEALSAIGKHLGILGNDVSQHLHLHSQATNPFINADPNLILEAKAAMTKLEHSVQGSIDNE